MSVYLYIEKIPALISFKHFIPRFLNEGQRSAEEMYAPTHRQVKVYINISRHTIQSLGLGVSGYTHPKEPREMPGVQTLRTLFPLH